MPGRLNLRAAIGGMLCVPLLATLPIGHLSDRQTAESHFTRAAELMQAGQLEEAEKEYRAGLEIAPGNPQALNHLGVIYFKKHDLRQAIATFKQADRLQPANAEIAFNLGPALYQNGESEAALPYLGFQVKSQACETREVELASGSGIHIFIID
jgi:Flp pilus assembly protein TadD